MARRVSYSLVDPYLAPLMLMVYRLLPIPRRFPPEGIVLVGHLIAVAGGFAFAFSSTYWWAGLLAGVCVAGNHFCDMIDGTHARTTDQCRNGGELLDHFVDPMSFAYWAIGIAVSAQVTALGFAAVIAIFATAVLTNIKAKMTGEFTLARIGPTEFKLSLTVYGLSMAVAVGTAVEHSSAMLAARVFLAVLTAGLLAQLIVNLIRSIRQVNRQGSAPDSSDWRLSGGASGKETQEQE